MVQGKKDLPLEGMAHTAAMVNAMNGQTIFLAHGSRLFFVGSGWESRTIAADRNSFVCHTVTDLQSAMTNPHCAVIFISAEALLTQADIERVCERNGVAKTIFQERRAS